MQPSSSTALPLRLKVPPGYHVCILRSVPNIANQTFSFLLNKNSGHRRASHLYIHPLPCFWVAFFSFPSLLRGLVQALTLSVKTRMAALWSRHRGPSVSSSSRCNLFLLHRPPLCSMVYTCHTCKSVFIKWVIN